MPLDWEEQFDTALRNAAETQSSWDSVDLQSYVKVLPVNSWEDIRAIAVEHRDGWFYRGQKDSSWRLRPSLERFTTYPVPRFSRDTKGVTVEGVTEIPQDAFFAEYELSREFKRRAHHYLNDVPSFDDHLEWLALMQHHGVPTRLLDFTKSPYVALYFAAIDVDDSGTCAVWAVNAEAMDEIAIAALGLASAPASPSGAREYYLKARADFERGFVINPRVGVAPVQPFRMNERLTVQQGAFLCPGNLMLPFEKNLAGMIAGANADFELIRIDIPGEMRPLLIWELNRMNINHATLFPGLDGFSAYLRNEFSLRHTLSLKHALAAFPKGKVPSIK